MGGERNGDYVKPKDPQLDTNSDVAVHNLKLKTLDHQGLYFNIYNHKKQSQHESKAK